MVRFITGAVGVLIMIPVCFFSHTVIYPFLLSVFALIAVYEILSCIGTVSEKVVAIPSFLFSLLPLATYFLVVKTDLVDNVFQCIFIFSGFYFAFVQMLSCLVKNRIHSSSLYSAVALVLYVVISFTAISYVRYIDHGSEEGKYIYLLIFFGAWISDTFAYFSGRLFGKTPLAPEISPKKTVEGSIGAVLANMIVFAGYAFVLRSCFAVSANVVFFAVLGALFSAVGQFGDLFASCIKRHFNVKDYGKLFPGHGGVLDRFDSTLAIAWMMLVVYSAFGYNFLIG